MKQLIDWYYGDLHENSSDLTAKRMYQRDKTARQLNKEKYGYLYIRRVRVLSKSYELFKERGVFSVAVNDIIKPFGLKPYHFHCLYRNRNLLIKELQEVYGNGEVKIEDTF